ncbi:unnamed protein product [Caenorhabditis angaria]|uniref:DUF4783 domain-containing protein n=1 Tax=Caenorhabditis angaria TaxID=860376 RepID=A0A9P1IFQ2_9PELO|nr:unnamed protein product [Caenorhabditis angaria]
MIKLSIFLIVIPIVFSSPIQPSQDNSIIGYQFLNTLLNSSRTDDYSIFNQTFEGTVYRNKDFIRTLSREKIFKALRLISKIKKTVQEIFRTPETRFIVFHRNGRAEGLHIKNRNSKGYTSFRVTILAENRYRLDAFKIQYIDRAPIDYSNQKLLSMLLT